VELYVLTQREAKEIVLRMFQGDTLKEAFPRVTGRRLSRTKRSHDLSWVWSLIAAEGEHMELSLPLAIEVFLRGTFESRLALLQNTMLLLWCRESRPLLDLVQEYRARFGEP
jgi:hypothetical protein